jgi:division protein CdvB (Snf7/Vps24/ESCRT-III family)
MEPNKPITALIQTVEKLLSHFQDSRRENTQLRLENADLQQKIADYRISEAHLQQTISKLKYKNDLAKAKVESIINRLQAIDAGLQETAEARAAAHNLAQTALSEPNAELTETDYSEEANSKRQAAPA